jgi:hypothetical protein
MPNQDNIFLYFGIKENSDTQIKKYSDLDIVYIMQLPMHLVSKWLLFNTNSAIFQLNHNTKNLLFNEMVMKTALY